MRHELRREFVEVARQVHAVIVHAGVAVLLK
jgi:hypothetical protein